MLTMRNYHNLRKQLEISNTYLESLKEQKEVLDSFLSPKAVNYDSVTVKGGSNTDPFAIYTFNSMRLEKQIKAVKTEIKSIKNTLDKMEELLRDVHNNRYKIFVFRYLDGLSVNEIAKRTNFSERRIYQILKEIKSIVES